MCFGNFFYQNATVMNYNANCLTSTKVSNDSDVTSVTIMSGLIFIIKSNEM